MERIALTDGTSGGIAPGLLPADVDVEAVLRDGDERELAAAWNTYFERALAQRITADPDARPEGVDVFEHVLAGLAPVTAAQALEANRRLVELLTGRRWMVMRDAREAGASWTDIGAALGMSRQGAYEWYQRKIELQEEHVPEFHDTARARAVLGDT
ncbi:hypothetical protein BJF85_07045 [Saccharomonospora sp. CUA-673]|uniref:hypothetical protein n=1 Tax=Saccharomonospora sp. CUA-673 TaxID=1904969 RepID=UPI000959D834|nr:hypothetical protein [Saccharomonospora sp. CUA-673]OLT40059.1 hypothetical protein BJF85_07045 [Saccharomonospora sp. CUA-673]